MLPDPTRRNAAILEALRHLEVRRQGKILFREAMEIQEEDTYQEEEDEDNDLK
jgi:hypothetical protein